MISIKSIAKFFLLFNVILIFGCKTVHKPFVIIEVGRHNVDIYLEGVSDPEEVIFEGSELSYGYRIDGRSFKITGVGTIFYKDNAINVDQYGVKINGRELSKAKAYNYYVLFGNGDIREGFLQWE